MPLAKLMSDPNGIRSTSSGMHKGRPTKDSVVPKLLPIVRLVENDRLQQELEPELLLQPPEPEL